jgi:RNA-directed DNA polymerase
MMVKANMTVRHFNLVLPLAQKATATRIMETADSVQNVSSAVSPLIGNSLRQSDVDSKIQRSTPLIQIMPGIRISTMETRTTTTRITSSAPALSADQYERHHADFTFTELVQAYFDCRKNKRNTATALLFEQDLESNLAGLYDDLIDGTYAPGKSICFVITRPKAREVWAADFRDRIVHHLFYNKISPRFYASFITDSCACIPGRGTLYAAKRLEAKIRSATENWSKPCFYLKCDLANFFVAIDKNIVHQQLAAKVIEPWWLWLGDLILFHDPRLNYELRGDPDKINLVPAHKRLINQPSELGLPIGNLSSQFFANIYLNSLDQYIKHQIGAKHYIRYVDDFVLLHESPAWLNNALNSINTFLPAKLHAKLNPTKTILQPVDRGVDFVVQVIKPWCRYTRKRTVNEAISQVKKSKKGELFEVANSYFGLLGQADKSHHDRARLANALRGRGYSIKADLTKTYRNKADVLKQRSFSND